MPIVEVNPYVIRIDKFVNSLEKLSHIFLHLEEKESLLTEEEYQSICEDVSERACKHCGHREMCLGKEKEHTYDMIREVVRTTENY